VRYSVEITGPAEQNIEEAHDWIHAESDAAAAHWIDGLLTSFLSLETFPLRCTMAPESSDHEEEIHQLLYGRYRILFVVRKRKVFVLHIRHSPRDRARMEEL
jgi:plasmid stabilization system protein ParE